MYFYVFKHNASPNCLNSVLNTIVVCIENTENTYSPFLCYKINIIDS